MSHTKQRHVCYETHIGLPIIHFAWTHSPNEMEVPSQEAPRARMPNLFLPVRFNSAPLRTICKSYYLQTVLPSKFVHDGFVAFHAHVVCIAPQAVSYCAISLQAGYQKPNGLSPL